MFTVRTQMHNTYIHYASLEFLLIPTHHMLSELLSVHFLYWYEYLRYCLS